MRNLLAILYGLWCVMIVLGYASAGNSGVSPFADGGRTAFFFAGSSGPHHK